MNKGIYILLHFLLVFYSLGGIFSKLASREAFLSQNFLLLYFGVLVILFVYAIWWQQIIKKMPLTTAYMNRAVCILWGILWGVLFFDEHITAQTIIGAVIVMIGVVMAIDK